MAIDRNFKENRGDSSIFNPSYLSCKGLLLEVYGVQIR